MIVKVLHVIGFVLLVGFGIHIYIYKTRFFLPADFGIYIGLYTKRFFLPVGFGIYIYKKTRFISKTNKIYK